MNKSAEFSAESLDPNDPEIIVDQVSNLPTAKGNGPASGPFVPPDSPLSFEARIMDDSVQR